MSNQYLSEIEVAFTQLFPAYPIQHFQQLVYAAQLALRVLENRNLDEEDLIWKRWCLIWEGLDSDDKIEYTKCLIHRMNSFEAETLFSEIEDIPVIRERLTMRGYK